MTDEEFPENQVEAPEDEEELEDLEHDEGGSSGGGMFLMMVLAFLACTGVLAAVLIPNFIRARSRGQLTACKSNLKNIGTAMEMYSTDWGGKYPTGNVKAFLTPNYLKTIPYCPAAGTDTYTFELGMKATYNTGSYEDYYFVYCSGTNHTNVSVPLNYPQYNGIVGLFER